MIVKPCYLNCLAHASYLIGDEETGIADDHGTPRHRGQNDEFLGVSVSLWFVGVKGASI